ncbi:14522_t:CDS:2, partial [Racocetra persica]
LSKAAVTPILSARAYHKISLINIIEVFGRIQSLIACQLGNFNIGIINLKTSWVSWFSIKLLKGTCCFIFGGANLLVDEMNSFVKSKLDVDVEVSEIIVESLFSESESSFLAISTDQEKISVILSALYCSLKFGQLRRWLRYSFALLETKYLGFVIATSK